MAAPKDPVHAGHRERMRKRFIENGFDGFEEHQALEMFLFYAIPRKDTNELAHKLLERYFTIAGVCSAPVDELQRDFHKSETAATFLKMLPEMSRLYYESLHSTSSEVDLENLGEWMKQKFIGRTAEAVVLLLVDAKGCMIYFDVVSKGSIALAEMPTRKIVELAIRHNSKTAFVAHNHPSGDPVPSAADIVTTRNIIAAGKSLELPLLDHVIIGQGSFTSIKSYLE